MFFAMMRVCSSPKVLLQLNCIAVFGFLAMAIFMEIYSCGLPCNVHFLDVDKGLPVGVRVIA